MTLRPDALRQSVEGCLLAKVGMRCYQLLLAVRHFQFQQMREPLHLGGWCRIDRKGIAQTVVGDGKASLKYSIAAGTFARVTYRSQRKVPASHYCYCNRGGPATSTSARNTLAHRTRKLRADRPRWSVPVVSRRPERGSHDRNGASSGCHWGDLSWRRI